MNQKCWVVSAWEKRTGIYLGLILSSLAAWQASAAAPDLIVNRYRLAHSTEIQYRYFSSSSCAAVERCVGGTGLRKLLLFDVGIANIGKGDLVIGNPEDRPDLFHMSPCHGHYHMTDFASYKILNRNGMVVLNKRKQGFCIRDDKKHLKNAGPSRGYTCDYQGLSRGWQDTYDKSLDCQWLDITGLRPGYYQLKVTANPRRIFRESNFANNSVTVPFRIR